jgi:hypothetical protein
MLMASSLCRDPMIRAGLDPPRVLPEGDSEPLIHGRYDIKAT